MHTTTTFSIPSTGKSFEEIWETAEKRYFIRPKKWAVIPASVYYARCPWN